MKEISPKHIELWKDIYKEAQEIIDREALLEDLIDDVVIKSLNVFDAITKRMARKLGQNAIHEKNLLRLFSKVFARDEAIREEVVANMLKISKEDSYYNSCAKVLLYSRQFQLSSAKIMIKYLMENGKEDIALYVNSLCID